MASYEIRNPGRPYMDQIGLMTEQQLDEERDRLRRVIDAAHAKDAEAHREIAHSYDKFYAVQQQLHWRFERKDSYWRQGGMYARWHHEKR